MPGAAMPMRLPGLEQGRLEQGRLEQGLACHAAIITAAARGWTRKDGFWTFVPRHPAVGMGAFGGGIIFPEGGQGSTTNTVTGAMFPLRDASCAMAHLSPDSGR
jgi:hypothetical protein